MVNRRLRVLVIASHPIQYAAPYFRRFSQHPGVELTVAYCSLRGVESGHDPEFGTNVSWDIPLLDGYRWIQVKNRALSRNEENFFGLCNPGLWKLTRSGEFDAVISYFGYRRISFWFALLGAKTRGIPILFGTDASSIVPREGKRWKRAIKLFGKRFVWRGLFSLADQVLTASTPGVEMIEALGFPPDRISMTLDAVDNDWWLAQAAFVDRKETRESWGMGAEEKVVLFSAKLQPWKRPGDLLEALVCVEMPTVRLVFAGEGSLRSELEERAKTLGIESRVKFLGFVNQTKLPAVYASADLMVLPSEYEPFGLVVNEAMLCGCPVLASDRVGAVRDLIEDGRTGYVYACGNADELAKTMSRILSHPEKLSEVAREAKKRIENWSYKEAIDNTVEGLQRAIARKQRRAGLEKEASPT
jgi:glycosyltransferase involved in cell wall biosynthesis